MNENARKWVQALRSGEFQQAKGTLRDQDGRMCCLGVACEVYRREVGGEWRDEQFGPPGESFQGGFLPLGVRDWLGLASHFALPKDRRRSLVRCNDSYGATFEEIADLIESEPEGLFR